jgi:hypothetical protein
VFASTERQSLNTAVLARTDAGVSGGFPGAEAFPRELHTRGHPQCRVAYAPDHALTRVAAFDNDREHDLLTGIDDWQLALDRVADDLRTTLTTRTGRSA